MAEMTCFVKLEGQKNIMPYFNYRTSPKYCRISKFEVCNRMIKQNITRYTFIKSILKLELNTKKLTQLLSSTKMYTCTTLNGKITHVPY